MRARALNLLTSPQILEITRTLRAHARLVTLYGFYRCCLCWIGFKPCHNNEGACCIGPEGPRVGGV